MSVFTNDEPWKCLHEHCWIWQLGFVGQVGHKPKHQHQEKMLFLSHSSMSFFDFFLFCKWNGSRRTERTLPYSVEGNVEILHRAPTRYHHPLSFTDEHHLMFFLKRHEWHFIIWIYHNSNWHRAAANRSTENNTSQQCGNKSNSEHNLIRFCF